MRNIFKRLFRIGKAEAHSAVDRLEDPIKMTEQGIRELKEDLEKGMKAMAQVKALAIRARNDHETYMDKAKEYERKAMLLLKQAQRGDLAPEEADRLATEALLRKEENVQLAARALADKQKFEGNVNTLDGNIKGLKSKIAHYENELKTLKARVKVAKATKNINQQMAQLDSDGTVSMLERMKDKVAEEEALAESYGEMAEETYTLDQEIEQALGDANLSEASDELAKLKEKMGLTNKDDESSDS